MDSGYFQANGQFADTQAVDLSPVGALSVDVTSRVIEVGARGTLRLVLNATAVSASDTVDVTIQTSFDGINNWYSAGTFTQVAAPGVQRKVFPVDRFVRASYDVTGSAISISLTLAGEAC